MGLGVLALLTTAFVMTNSVAPHLGANHDLLGRLTNLETLRTSGNIYSPFGVEAFTYPPGAILLFLPILWIPMGLLPFLWTLVSLLALVVVFAVVLSRHLHKSRAVTAAVACWAAVIAAFAFPPVTECLTWGQTGTLLLALIVVDYLVLRGPANGILVGLATAFKIYPCLFIVVWMMRRQWRAAFTAIVTFCIVTGLAWLLWPESASAYVSKLVLGGSELAHFSTFQAMTASSSFAALFSRPPFRPDLLNDVGTIAISVVVVAAGLFGAQRLWRRNLELNAMTLVLVTSAIGAPLAWDHYFIFAPLLLLTPLEVGWKSPLGRIAIGAAAIMTFPWFHFRRPISSTFWEITYSFTARNAILFASLALLTVAFADRSAVELS